MRILFQTGLLFGAAAIVSGCFFETRYQPPTILILGNSITFSDTNTASFGWHHNWGMAATAIDSDYVHQTLRLLGTQGFEAKAEIGHRDCVVCDGPIDEYTQNVAMDVAHTRPRWVVVQLGENSNLTEVLSGKLYLQYLKLLVALREKGDFPIFCITNWSDTSLDAPHTAAVRKAMSGIPGTHLVDITNVSKKAENFGDPAVYSDPAVQWHPGNLGMAGIAAALADSMKAYP